MAKVENGDNGQSKVENGDRILHKTCFVKLAHDRSLFTIQVLKKCPPRWKLKVNMLRSQLENISMTLKFFHQLLLLLLSWAAIKACDKQQPKHKSKKIRKIPKHKSTKVQIWKITTTKTQKYKKDEKSNYQSSPVMQKSITSKLYEVMYSIPWVCCASGNVDFNFCFLDVWTYKWQRM